MKRIFLIISLFLSTFLFEACTQMTAQARGTGERVLTSDAKIEQMRQLLLQKNKQLELMIKRDSCQLYKLKKQIDKYKKDKNSAFNYVYPPYASKQ